LLAFDGDQNAGWQFAFDEDANTLYVTAWTTFYKVLSGPSGAVNAWVPFDPAMVNFKPATPYSILLREMDDVAVYESIDHNSVRVFPNPSNELVTIEWNMEAEELVVVDALGRIVYYQRDLEGRTRHELSVSALASGAYTVRVIGANEQSSHLFVKP
jgi:hypothetical protein